MQESKSLSSRRSSSSKDVEMAALIDANPGQNLSALEAVALNGDVGEQLTSYGYVPTGYWRDSMWDLCEFGPFHATVCVGCCCTPCAAAQVATRLELSEDFYVCRCYQSKASTSRKMSTAVFFRLVWLVVFYYITRVLIFAIITVLDPNTDAPEWVEPGNAYYFFCRADDLLWLVYTVWYIVLVYRVRVATRQMYSIPETGTVCVRGSEDLCCATLCPCLTVAQVMRHTADYSSHEARCCCSPSGLNFRTTDTAAPIV